MVSSGKLYESFTKSRDIRAYNNAGFNKNLNQVLFQNQADPKNLSGSLFYRAFWERIADKPFQMYDTRHDMPTYIIDDKTGNKISCEFTHGHDLASPKLQKDQPHIHCIDNENSKWLNQDEIYASPIVVSTNSLTPTLLKEYNQQSAVAPNQEAPRQEKSKTTTTATQISSFGILPKPQPQTQPQYSVESQMQAYWKNNWADLKEFLSDGFTLNNPDTLKKEFELLLDNFRNLKKILDPHWDRPDIENLYLDFDSTRIMIKDACDEMSGKAPQIPTDDDLKTAMIEINKVITNLQKKFPPPASRQNVLKQSIFDE